VPNCFSPSPFTSRRKSWAPNSFLLTCSASQRLYYSRICIWWSPASSDETWQSHRFETPLAHTWLPGVGHGIWLLFTQCECFLFQVACISQPTCIGTQRSRSRIGVPQQNRCYWCSSNWWQRHLHLWCNTYHSQVSHSLGERGSHLSLFLSPNVKEDGDHIDIYTANAIQSHAKVCLTCGGMLLIALLSGGDYDVSIQYY